MKNYQENKEPSFFAGLVDDIKKLWEKITSKQNLSEQRKKMVISIMEESSTPGFDFYLLIVLSCTIATLGLVTNSAAVIIGAMLIAPLLPPILGLSMSSLTGRSMLFRRSLISIFTGALLAIVLSAIITFIAYRIPYGIPDSIPTEIAARTKPSPLDLGIALAGGAAAAYAMTRPHLTSAIPGVAISTALMPPLCTIGIGIAFADRTILLGSTLLFLTNLSAISFAGIITFALSGFRPRKNKMSTRKIPQSITFSALFVIIITIPLMILSWNTISSARLERQVKDILNQQIDIIENAHLVNVEIQDVDNTKKVVATIRTSRSLTFSEVSIIQQMLADETQKPISLEMVVIPISELDTLYPPTPTVIVPTATATNTPLPTATGTPQPKPTPTPIPAFINSRNNSSQDIYDEPNGNKSFALPNDSPVWVLEEMNVDNVTWMHIVDVFGRSGWVKASNLIID